MNSQFLLDYSHGREHRSLPERGQGEFGREVDKGKVLS